MRVRISSGGKFRVSSGRVSYSNRGGVRLRTGRVSWGKTGPRVSTRVGPVRLSTAKTGTRGAVTGGFGPFYGGFNKSGGFAGISFGTRRMRSRQRPTTYGGGRQSIARSSLRTQWRAGRIEASPMQEVVVSPSGAFRIDNRCLVWEEYVEQARAYHGTHPAEGEIRRSWDELPPEEKVRIELGAVDLRAIREDGCRYAIGSDGLLKIEGLEPAVRAHAAGIAAVRQRYDATR